MKNNILMLTRVLTLVIAALLVGSVWGFTTNQDSEINANLTVTGALKIGSVEEITSGTSSAGSNDGIVTSTETIASNANREDTIPTTKAVKAYVDDRLEATGLWYLKVTGLTRGGFSTLYTAQLKPSGSPTLITKQAITPDLVTFDSAAGKLTLASGNKYILTYFTSYYRDVWELEDSETSNFYLTEDVCSVSYEETSGYPYLEQTIDLKSVNAEKHFYFCVYIMDEKFQTQEDATATLDVLIRTVE